MADRVADWHERGYSPKGGTRYNVRRVITAPPTFESTEFECTVYRVQANSAGDWMVTIKIPYEFREAAMDLGGAYGVALETTMQKKGREDGEGA